MFDTKLLNVSFTIIVVIIICYCNSRSISRKVFHSIKVKGRLLAGIDIPVERQTERQRNERMWVLTNKSNRRSDTLKLEYEKNVAIISLFYSLCSKFTPCCWLLMSTTTLQNLTEVYTLLTSTRFVFPRGSKVIVISIYIWVFGIMNSDLYSYVQWKCTQGMLVERILRRWGISVIKLKSQLLNTLIWLFLQ